MTSTSHILSMDNFDEGEQELSSHTWQWRTKQQIKWHIPLTIKCEWTNDLWLSKPVGQRKHKHATHVMVCGTCFIFPMCMHHTHPPPLCLCNKNCSWNMPYILFITLPSHIVCPFLSRSDIVKLCDVVICNFDFVPQGRYLPEAIMLCLFWVWSDIVVICNIMVCNFDSSLPSHTLPSK